jgi:hypothetical protein
MRLVHLLPLLVAGAAVRGDAGMWQGSDEGGGQFGNWSASGDAFLFSLDESSPAAIWNSSESGFPLYVNRSDHFIVTGNDRVRVE